MISSKLEQIENKNVVDFSPEEGIKDPKNLAYRIQISYDDAEFYGEDSEELKNCVWLEPMLNDKNIGELETLIIGTWGFEYEGSSEAVVKKLIENRDKLKSLKYLMIGDITYEECEISWIIQSNMTKLLENFPNLEAFHVRGGERLSFDKLKESNIKKLIVETGGLSKKVINDIAKANLPNLEYLDLWFGSEDYGFDASLEEVTQFINPEKYPKLRHLGLMNCIYSDEIAENLAKSTMISQLEEIDLSKGILTDAGVKSLLSNPNIQNFKKLNLNESYISESFAEEIQEKYPFVSLEDLKNEDDEYDGNRYVSVAE